MATFKKAHFFLGLALALCFTAAAQQKPNFVFVMVDDQAYDLLQSAGRYKFLRTPNMDRIGKEGANFANYFSVQSLCSPQRASILTGVYPHLHGITQNHAKVDPDWNKFPTLGTMLQKAGYETAFIGKIHMAHKSGKEHIRPGFDEWISFNGQGVYNDPILNINGEEIKKPGYITDILTDYTVDFIKNHDKQKPFMVFLWHKAIHGPHTPAERDMDLYKNEPLPYPPYDTYRENFAGKPKWLIGRSLNRTDYDALPDSLPEQPWNANNKKMLRMLKTLNAVDESLGTIYKTLEKTKQLDNTVIIFTSDNGYFMGDHTFSDKRLAYEASMRIPLLMRFPKIIKKGSVINQLVNTVDITASILDMAGAKKPDYIQGESFVPLLKGENISWRKSLFYEYFRDLSYPHAAPTFYAVRTNRYKYIHPVLKGQIDELYDLEKDPGEMKNLVNNVAYNGILNDLKKEAEILKTKYKYNPDGDWRIRDLLGEKAIVPREGKNANNNVSDSE